MTCAYTEMGNLPAQWAQVKTVPVRRVNHAQIDVPIEAGKHQLRVFYFPWDFYLGLGVSALALATTATCAIILLRARKNAHAL